MQTGMQPDQVIHPIHPIQPVITPKRQHLTRLLRIWRSDGWPSKDALEIDLLVGGWVEMVQEAGHDKLRLTPAGLTLIAASRQRNQRALSAHDRLAEHVAAQLHDAGRVVWRELSLRARVETAIQTGIDSPAVETPSSEGSAWAQGLFDSDPQDTVGHPVQSGAWRMARPDVFSVRNTSVEAYLQPVVHEIKVSRADLLSDLRHEAKRASYQWLCCECHYVFPAGMAQPEELPPELGVWVVHGDLMGGAGGSAGDGDVDSAGSLNPANSTLLRLELLRPARHTPCTLPFPVWLALAKASPWQPEHDPRQRHLGQPDGGLPGDAS